MSYDSKTKGKMDLSRGIFARLGRFRGDQRGNVLMIVGLAIIPLVAALGLATDASRGYLLKARLSQALDSAALAGGKVIFTATQAERDADVLKYFRANFPTSSPAAAFDTPFNADFMGAQVTLNAPVQGIDALNQTTLSLSASAVIPTTFMRVLGFQDMAVSGATQVTRELKALDAVISMDMSGSMTEVVAGTKKITAARQASKVFVHTVFGAATISPKVTIAGTTYDLLHVGFVPWNAKTRVQVQTTSGLSAITPVTIKTVPQFINPVTGLKQTKLYYANNSSVPLLMDPRDSETTNEGQLPGGWSGCVYARYLGGETSSGAANTPNLDKNDNDADYLKGPQTLGGKAWVGYEPMAVRDSEPGAGLSGNWNNAQAGDTVSPYNWYANSAGNNHRTRRCNNAYVNDGNAAPAQWPNDLSNDSVNFDLPTEPYVDGSGTGTVNGLYDPPEPFTDTNGNGVRDAGEAYNDINGNGSYDTGELFTDLNGNKKNDGGEVKKDSPLGSPPRVSRPYGTVFANGLTAVSSVPNFKRPPTSTKVGNPLYTDKWAGYSGSFRYVDVTKPYALPANFGTNPGTGADCTACLGRGIVPLQTNRDMLTTQKADPGGTGILDKILDTDPAGNTNLEQGLYWAWEVMMPGEPFDEAIGAVPPDLNRTRAIILMTDGNQVGGNGDAYKGAFGSGEIAGNTADPAHGTIRVGFNDTGATVENNLDNRVRRLANNVKADGIKLYVIALGLGGDTKALTLLSEIATQAPGEQYFYQVDDPAQLTPVFQKIAASLSTVRVSM